VALRAGLQWGWFAVPREISFEQVVGAPAGGIAAGLATILSIFFMLNLILLIFNLLPLPPLDGSGALPLVLPRRIAGRYLEFIRQPGFGLIGIIVAWNLFPKVFLPVARVLLGLLHMGL
jgi:Zn-dependent protease